MCPCSPNDVSFNIPDGPSGPAIPGFGVPFAIPTPQISLPDGFPENLMDLLNKLQLLIPPGALKPQLNPNFGKDIYDGIMKLLDQFMPFLMLYKFFLPILELIICIIEVLCALMNPFKLISALNRLFGQCIPAFLNLFPIFALICMIISLLLLLLALIEYIIAQILKFILAILRNIRALIKAFHLADATAILAIAHKLGALLCIFQNLFVLLSIFAAIIQIIKDILSLIFAIPPCQDGGPNSTDGCCTADVCPAIVKGSPYTNKTGTFQYLPEVGVQTSLVLPPPFNNFNFDLRTESWQLYDTQQSQGQAFWNIVDGYDVPVPNQVAGNKKPVFFPTDASYTANTDPQQAAYTVDLRLFYNPQHWTPARSGTPRYIRFNKCIVLNVPTQNLLNYKNDPVSVPNGVLYIAGGQGYEDDNDTPLVGFMPDGITPIPDGTQATLNNFLHMPAEYSTSPVFSPTDGYTFSDMTYTFTPNIGVLLQKNLVTLGCEPTLAFNRAFLQGSFAAGLGVQSQLMSDLVHGANGQTFPDPAECQACLTQAVTALRSNLTVEGVAIFKTTTDACLGKLRDDTKKALGATVTIGFDPCSSTVSLSPSIQFTGQPINVTVNINERNKIPLTAGFPTDVAATIQAQIKGFASLANANVSHFAYDGYQAFTAQITSDNPGSGDLMVAFANQIFCTNTFPDNVGTAPVQLPSHTLQKHPFQFVYTPTGSTIPLPPTGESGELDTDGKQPRRDAGDISRDAPSDGGKDGS